MNNRIQQRFDRSIREAVAMMQAVKDRESAAALVRAKQRAAKEIPVIEELIERGAKLNGQPLTKSEIAELRSMLEEKRRFVA